MKKLRILLVVIFLAETASAQTLAEWTKQKKTQITYLKKQIAALQIYASYVKKGYDIAKEGVNAIHAIKQGDFSLNENYFSSFKNVNHNVKAYTKISAIIARQVNIVKACHQQKLYMNKSNQFTSDEISYAGKVFANLLDGCTGIIDQLIVITTDGLLQMKDDERIKQIDHLYNDMQQRYEFVQHFGSENNMLAVRRMKDNNDVQVSRGLYGH